MEDFTPEQKEYRDFLHGWFAAELCAQDRQRAEFAPPGTLMLGAAVWGDYIDRFLDLAARTLMAKGNADALRGRAHLVLFTNAEGYDRLWRPARAIGRLFGRPPQVFIIPDAAMAWLPKHPDNVNPLLGAIQNFQVQVAGRHEMAYHPLFPDHLYCDTYFAGLLKLAETHRAIAQTSISADLASVKAELGRYRQADGTLAIPSRPLGEMGFRNLHPQSIGNLMNRGPEMLGYPTSHCTIWQGKDRAYVHCCHVNAAYLSPELCAAAPVRYFSPLDCNLPYIIPNDEFYVPTVEDGMTFIELSDHRKSGSNRRVDIELYSAVCWHHVKFRDVFLPYFAKGSEVPIGLQGGYLTAEEIRDRHAKLIEDLKAHKNIVRDRIKFENGVTRYTKEAA
jgi:hypothetical protein